jgi:hypothetical protein
MTPNWTPPNLNPDTYSENTVFVEFESAGEELTPEVLNRPRYGRPDPRRYLPDDERPPADPPPAK